MCCVKLAAGSTDDECAAEVFLITCVGLNSPSGDLFTDL